MKTLILSAISILCFPLAVTPAFAQAGHLDATFGSGGVVANAPLTEFTAAALAANGDIVVAGGIDGTAAIVRYLPSGALDPSFGTDGLLMLPAPASFFLGESFMLGIAVQTNGKILATFYAFNNTSTESETVLLRLNANGQPDTTFGSGGQVPLSFPVPAGWGASATLVLAQPDGKILVTGNIVPPFRNHSAPLTLLARYLTNGALDTTFGTNGIEEVVAPVDLPSSLALLSGDGILPLNDQGTIVVSQFSPSGAPVTPSTGGTIIASDPTGTTAFQTNGDFLIAGTVAGPDGRLNVDATVERFELNGVEDPSFQPPTIRFGPDGADVKNAPAGVAVDSTGRVLVAAEFESSTFGSGVARLNSNGSLDTTFGSAGIGALVPDFVVYAILVQPDNKAIMVGSGGNLARYLAQ
jgi:uncharacterized delta-60 repeat protein